jgi:hypothetical protein
MFFGFTGGENQFYENPDFLGKTTGDDYRGYGGHRLWHAPEAVPRTKMPDNDPVAASAVEGGMRFTQRVEAQTGIEKEIDILEGAGGALRLVHRLRNHGLWPVDLAPWALSVMAPGGTAIVPMPPRGTHPENLLPNTRLILWPYSDLTDRRWEFRRRHVLLHQDAAAVKPQKFGLNAPGWAAYLRAGVLFEKTFSMAEGAEYPDMGVTVEVFTNARMLELETLAPMIKLGPGASVEYEEVWTLKKGVGLEDYD